MKEKIKELSKRYLIGFILGIIVSGAISVIAATYFPSNQTTYDNTNTELKSENVQDAIDELYSVCFPPKGSDTITDLLPSNPDELYKDDHGDIRYYGANPNNYVSFNNELWRIMGVIDGKIKIVRDESIGRKYWASNGFNNWNNSDLKSYLNGEYYNNIDSTYKNMISKETYYLGGPTNSNYDTLTASEYYDMERSNSVFSGRPVSTTQYIGLMYPSDYGYAAGNSCLSTTLSDYYNSCRNNDYLAVYLSNHWLQTPRSDNSNFSFQVNTTGSVTSSYAKSYGDTYPTLYLISETQITGGTGTESDPYTLSL